MKTTIKQPSKTPQQLPNQKSKHGRAWSRGNYNSEPHENLLKADSIELEPASNVKKSMRKKYRPGTDYDLGPGMEIEIYCNFYTNWGWSMIDRNMSFEIKNAVLFHKCVINLLLLWFVLINVKSKIFKQSEWVRCSLLIESFSVSQSRFYCFVYRNLINNRSAIKISIFGTSMYS